MTPEQPRQPVFLTPLPIMISLAVLLLIHMVVAALSPEQIIQIYEKFGFTPILWTAWTDNLLPRPLYNPLFPAWSIITYGFVHGSWMHVIMNSLWLAVFGTPVVRRLAVERFMFVLILANIAGALMHWAFYPFGEEPVVGASAAVSGLMGAAVHFVFSGSSQQSGFRALFKNRTALLFIAFWFVSNLILGLAGDITGLVEGQIAWQAHIGGFLAGLFIFPFIDRGKNSTVANQI